MNSNITKSDIELIYSGWKRTEKIQDPTGDEPDIFMAIQILESLENWVEQSKLLELIKLTKKELFNYFENPYAILRAYHLLEDMKQNNLDILPEDFGWFNDVNTALEPVYKLINIPYKLILLKALDEDLYAISYAMELCFNPDLQPIFERKIQDITRIVSYLKRHEKEDRIIELAKFGELTYPLYLTEFGGIISLPRIIRTEEVHEDE